MEMTYTLARAEILETTELGYTLASLDRLWTCFIFDEWSEDVWWGNRLYFINELHTSYELWETELVWTTRTEAEAYAEKMRERFANSAREGETPPRVYVINLGDDHRFERQHLEGVPCHPRFRGSVAALNATAVMWSRTRERAAARPVEG